MNAKFLLLLSALCLGTCVRADAFARAATFRRFAYEGRDALAPCDAATEFRNPVIGGMAPDPSITRKGEWFYLAQSSFAYWPGIPVWRSRDLVDWAFVGSAIDRPSQASFGPGTGLSRGVFAPDIKYNPHNDTFYLLVTLVDAGGNVLFKTKDPAQGWSEPIRLGFGGIDPGIYFEDAETAYIVNNDDAPGGRPEYPGHRTIRCRPYDLVHDVCRNDRETILVNKGIRPAEKPIWCEGPHLYKIDGRYYLMTAEGGTADGHCEVVWTGAGPMGPFTPCKVNPILTQRDLNAGRPDPIVAAGHADLIETPDGEWFAVFLGIQPYRVGRRKFANTGRSTYLLPVTWIGAGDDRQPIILPAGREIPRVLPKTAFQRRAAAAGPVGRPVAGNVVFRDDFAAPELDPQWIQVRTPTDVWAQSGQGRLRLAARAADLGGTGNPSYLCRWVKNMNWTAEVEVDFAPQGARDFAGLACYQNERHFYAVGVAQGADGRRVVRVRKVDGETDVTVGEATLDAAGPVRVRIAADAGEVRFAFATGGGDWRPVAGIEDGTILSTDRAGGFVGATVGCFATAAQ